MMQAEKVAGDLRDAHEAVAGATSPVPALSAALRRLERRAAQAPALIEPAVKALDAALTALDDARGHLDQALRTADHDPRELERIEERLFALRAAARKYNVPVDGLNALAARYAADLGLIDAGAERLAALESAAHEAAANYRKAAAALSQAPQGGSRKTRRRGERRAQAAQARTGEIHDRDRDRAGRRRTARHRPHRVLGANQSRHAAGAADEGRLRRRARAFPAGAQGGAGRPRLGAHARLRRGRYRRRRRGRPTRSGCGWRGSARRAQVIAVHPCAAGGRARRSALPHQQETRSTRASGWRTRVAELAADKRREEIARMLAGAEITAEARAAAERLIKAAG